MKIHCKFTYSRSFSHWSEGRRNICIHDHNQNGGQGRCCSSCQHNGRREDKDPSDMDQGRAELLKEKITMIQIISLLQIVSVSWNRVLKFQKFQDCKNRKQTNNAIKKIDQPKMQCFWSFSVTQTTQV